jgi:hypothetical protein
MRIDRRKQPWKSGASAPRKPPRNQPRFSPGVLYHLCHSDRSRSASDGAERNPLFSRAEMDRIERTPSSATLDLRSLSRSGSQRLRLPHPCALCKGGNPNACGEGLDRSDRGSHPSKTTKGGAASVEVARGAKRKGGQPPVLLSGKQKKALTLLPERPRHPERYKCEGYREAWELLLPGLHLKSESTDRSVRSTRAKSAAR